jgi:hypothetical protein
MREAMTAIHAPSPVVARNPSTKARDAPGRKQPTHDHQAGADSHARRTRVEQRPAEPGAVIAGTCRTRPQPRPVPVARDDGHSAVVLERNQNHRS